MGRTQMGNNNAYCQDNDISWFDWRLPKKNAALRRYAEALIAFRKAEPTVRQVNFLRGLPVRPGGLPDVSWYNAEGAPVDWEQCDSSLICLLAAVPRAERESPPNNHVLLLCHSGIEPRDFTLPPLALPIRWRTFLNTGAVPPGDIYPELDGPPVPSNGIVRLESRSMACFVSPDTW